MGTDFFDDDLVKRVDRGTDSADRDFVSPSYPGAPSGRMSQQKDRLINQAADATEEIERMRRRQEELELEKARIEELNRKQNEYAKSKTELIDDLSKSLLRMEKDQVQANRMVELLSSTRTRFREMLEDVRDISEESWDDDVFAEELTRSLALVDDSRMEFNRAVAKIDAESWSSGQPAGGRSGVAERLGVGSSLADKGFFFWLKVGMALTLPLILILLALFAGYLFSLGSFG